MVHFNEDNEENCVQNSFIYKIRAILLFLRERFRYNDNIPYIIINYNNNNITILVYYNSNNHNNKGLLY